MLGNEPSQFIKLLSRGTSTVRLKMFELLEPNFSGASQVSNALCVIVCDDIKPRTLSLRSLL